MNNINLQPIADVANNAIDKISNAAGWMASHESLRSKALKSFIDDIQNSNIEPIHKAVLISNAKSILKGYKNQKEIIDIALQNLNETAKPEGVKDDWICEFMDMAKHVSDVEYRSIWGRILAGEMETPGSFSIGALEKLRCLSKKDAECFTKASKICMEYHGQHYILANTERGSGLDNYDFSYNDLLQLSDCGLMRLNSLSLKYKYDDQRDDSCMHNNSIVVYFDGDRNKDQEAELFAFAFTEAGNQLLKVVETEPEKEQILKELKYVASKFEWLDIKAYDVLSCNHEGIKHSDIELLKKE